MQLTLKTLFLLIALVLFVIAALVAFGAATVGNALGLIACGLAAVAVAFLVP